MSNARSGEHGMREELGATPELTLLELAPDERRGLAAEVGRSAGILDIVDNCRPIAAKQVESRVKRRQDLRTTNVVANRDPWHLPGARSICVAGWGQNISGTHGKSCAYQRGRDAGRGEIEHQVGWDGVCDRILGIPIFWRQ